MKTSYQLSAVSYQLSGFSHDLTAKGNTDDAAIAAGRSVNR
jgi:hypothetical protein